MNIRKSLFLALAVAGAALAGDPAQTLSQGEIGNCVKGGVLTSEQGTQLSGAYAAHAEYRTELQRLHAECEAYNRPAIADAGDTQNPARTERQKRMMQGEATTQYAEHRTSYNRLKAEDEKAAREAADQND